MTSTPDHTATSPELRDQTASVGRGVASLSLGQAVLMLMGGALALLMTQFFGKDDRTDAFFAAYGFYGVAVAFAQSLRLTALPRLIGLDGESQASRLLSATIVIGGLAAIPMIALAGPLGELIVDGDPTGRAATTLRELWPTLALQLLAGMFIAILVVRHVYVVVGALFAIASAISILGFVLLEPELGLSAVTVGLAMSALLLAVGLGAALLRSGWRFDWTTLPHPRRIIADGLWLTVASASAIVLNAGYLICVAVASREGTGVATDYAYAFFIIIFLLATTAMPAAMVRAPRLLNRKGDAGLTPEDVIADLRQTLVMLIPAIGVIAVAGVSGIDMLVGSFFSREDSELIVELVLALGPWLFASAAGVMVVLEMLNRGLARRLSAIALVHVLALLACSVVGVTLLGAIGVAIGQSVAMVVATLIQLRITFADRFAGVVASLLREAAIASAVFAVAFGAASVLVLALSGGLAAAGGASAAGLAVFALLARIAYGREIHALLA
ncbi:MAG: hypothetical protein WBK99_11080, partial [Solirubrobacterales bacterium]